MNDKGELLLRVQTLRQVKPSVVTSLCKLNVCLVGAHIPAAFDVHLMVIRLHVLWTGTI